MQKLSHPLLSFFFVVVVVYLPAWLPFTLPYQICYALRSLSPSPLCFTVFFPYIFRFTFISFSFLALQTISPWRRQSKTWPPCITLVGLWCLAHECTWLPPRLWMFLHHRLFLRLSWHGFYVFFTSSLPPPTSSPPLLAAAVGLTTVKKSYPSMHPSVITPCSLPPCHYKQLHACQLLPALLSARFFLLPYSILSPAIQIWFKQGNSSLLGKLCTNVRVKGSWLCGDLAHYPALCFPMHGPLCHVSLWLSAVPSQNIDIRHNGSVLGTREHCFMVLTVFSTFLNIGYVISEKCLIHHFTSTAPIFVFIH